MPSDLFDQSPEVIHETLGNDVGQWLLHADALYRAGAILYKAIGEPPGDGLDVNQVWDWFSVHNVGRMLRGMALECLIKAIWVAQGKVLVKEGRFVEIPTVKAHDLYAMYVASCPQHRGALTQEEKKTLARLSYAIVNARYPVSKKPRGNYPNAPTSPDKMQWNKCEHRVDSELFESLWSKLIAIAQEFDSGA